MYVHTATRVPFGATRRGTAARGEVATAAGGVGCTSGEAIVGDAAPPGLGLAAAQRGSDDAVGGSRPVALCGRFVDIGDAIIAATDVARPAAVVVALRGRAGPAIGDAKLLMGDMAPLLPPLPVPPRAGVCCGLVADPGGP